MWFWRGSRGRFDGIEHGSTQRFGGYARRAAEEVEEERCREQDDRDCEDRQPFSRMASVLASHRRAAPFLCVGARSRFLCRQRNSNTIL